jgi:16S rRNA pseudouridine516 synthase
MEKTYFFWARGDFTDEKIAKLEGGVSIFPNKEWLTAPAKVQRLEKATLRDIADLVGEDPVRLKNTRRGDIPVTSGLITITEGKKHQVKRMIKAVGMHVIYLERIAVGRVALDRSLERGQYRALTDEELEMLKNG